MHFFWFDSPFRAAWAVEVLKAPHDKLTRDLLDGEARGKQGREIVEKTRAALCATAGREWDALTAIVGDQLHPLYNILPGAARYQLWAKEPDGYPDPDQNDELWRVEHSFRDVLSGQSDQPCTINTTIEYPFYQHYSYFEMAQDESLALKSEAPPLLKAAWRVARSAGLWWPFRGAVVVSDRPVELHLNGKSLLHREDGPAALFRDGSRAWAWNGTPMKEEWLLHPKDIRPSLLKVLDASFRKFAKARMGTAKPKTKPKPSAILKQALPADSAARVELLRKHNRGSLPLYVRYMAGEHAKVWHDLVELGPSVREDPHAADALAVAYETMSRVSANVSTITARLKAMYFEKKEGTLHQPPAAKSRKLIPRLEKMAGTLPLSLRAFYDLVGGVDWTGHHTAIAPRNDTINPDPLVVFPIEIALQCCESGEGEGTIFIAPDEVFKAGAGGGDAYEIDVPCLEADGKLRNERHDAYFVEYLRLAFRFGGFPGYDGIETCPVALADLSRGLIEF